MIGPPDQLGDNVVPSETGRPYVSELRHFSCSGPAATLLGHQVRSLKTRALRVLAKPESAGGHTGGSVDGAFPGEMLGPQHMRSVSVWNTGGIGQYQTSRRGPRWHQGCNTGTRADATPPSTYYELDRADPETGGATW